jgi:16S rRNA processing protein RimM
VEIREKLLPFFIETISVRGSKAFLKLEEVDTPEQARNISKSSLYLPKSSRPKSGSGKFYDDEVIGFEVVDTTTGPLGKITEIVQAGPNKLLSVGYQGREVLVPLNSPFIESVNKTKKKITVSLPEGFLDI